jgi:predicted nuclease of restriction endonuclease-like RecB superfamily
VWVSEEERWFVGRFRELGGPWTLDDEPRLLQLAGGDVVVPDYALRHEDGREVFLEIVWFWRKASLEPRLKMLAKKAPPNLILAVSDRLRASKEDLEACPVPLHRFKGVLLPKPLIALAEKAAKPAPKRRGRAAGAGSAPSGPARKRRASRPAE